VSELEQYLTRCVGEGYTVLGVEQAGDSTGLQEFRFPRKSVLLLG
jgi:tRNA G18 (ribose-2'-O)-methylase SpoU